MDLLAELADAQKRVADLMYAQSLQEKITQQYKARCQHVFETLSPLCKNVVPLPTHISDEEQMDLHFTQQAVARIVANLPNLIGTHAAMNSPIILLGELPLCCYTDLNQNPWQDREYVSLECEQDEVYVRNPYHWLITVLEQLNIKVELTRTLPHFNHPTILLDITELIKIHEDEDPEPISRARTTNHNESEQQAVKQESILGKPGVIGDPPGIADIPPPKHPEWADDLTGNVEQPSNEHYVEISGERMRKLQKSHLTTPSTPENLPTADDPFPVTPVIPPSQKAVLVVDEDD